MTARAAIVAALQSVPEIGVVHDRERYAANLASMKDLYWSAAHNQVRGWFVRRVGARETGVLPPIFLDVETWRIQGYLGWDDAVSSELQLEALVEAARDRFRVDSTLGGAVLRTGLLARGSERGLQLEDSGPVMFCGVLCHGARLSLTTTTERHQ